jgi:hypothetical protein
MVITPRPGVNRDNLLKALQSVQGELSNLHSGAGNARNAQERALAYLKWTNSAVRMLGNQISPSDLDRLVLTDRYKLLLTAAGTLTGADTPTQAVLNGLIDREVEAQLHSFNAVVEALQRQILQWSGYEQYVMADTSVYIHHPDKLETIDPAPCSAIRMLTSSCSSPWSWWTNLTGSRKAKTGRPGGVPATRWQCWSGCSSAGYRGRYTEKEKQNRW